jgi:hypothetical protein
MPDCSATSIKIGGTLKEEHVEEFCELIRAEGLGEDWDEGLGEKAEEVIRGWDPKKPLILFDNEHPWGSCEELETFCREIGLAYCRADDGHYEWDGSVVFWKPGMAEEQDWIGTNDGEPCLSWKAIKAHRASNTLDAALALMEEASEFPFPFSAPDEPAKESAA